MRSIRRYFYTMQQDMLLSTDNRLCVQLKLFCIAAICVGSVMTILNFARGEWTLGVETAIGTGLSVLAYTNVSKTGNYLPGALSVAVVFLVIIVIFLISGAVEGFAALWYCLYPFVCLFLMDMKPAIAFCLLGLIVLMLCLWTPLVAILPNVYTQNFILRFPLLYVGNLSFALALNGFYAYTYNRLLVLNKKFEVLSNEDGLTKLSNRTYLEQYEKRLISKGGTGVFAIMADVDDFKMYNDTYGHVAGDHVLKSIAAEITELLPKEDAVAARYGGEEFLILLCGYDRAYVMQLAERIHSGILDLNIEHSHRENGRVSISLGIGEGYISSHEEFNALLKEADDALYRAKQSGRNCIIA